MRLSSDSSFTRGIILRDSIEALSSAVKVLGYWLRL